MISKRLLCTLAIAGALVAFGARKDARKKEAEDSADVEQEVALDVPEEVKNWDPYVALQNAFKKEGYTAPQVAKIQHKLFSDSLAKKKWPFPDHGKELAMSVSNVANNNAGSVAEAITKAGGDPSDINSLTDDVWSKSAAALAAEKTNEASPSLLQEAELSSVPPVPAPVAALGEQSAANFLAIETLTAQLSLQAGNVATNTAALGQLSYAAATNSAYIASLGGQVATLQGVTAPTMQLAASMGVPISTVASLSLAGAFVGPLLGVIALVYAAWPEEEIDPWLKIEGRVAKMLEDRFDAKRRTRLGDRQRRYLKQFSRCSQGWIAHSMVELNGVTVPRWLVEEAEKAKKVADAGGEFDLSVFPTEHDYPVPRCMAQLEGHMSLERDEWYGTESGGFSGLFMPFANLHTQILSILSDDPFDHKMKWGTTLKATSAEYGAYMLDHLLSAWKAQVCRSMRLRHSMKGVFGSYRYQFVVLREMYQPHAAEECADKCQGGGGWCNFCGGKNDGACCKRGDGGVCKRFDVPLSWHGSAKSYCIHTDCIQSNTGYYGTKLKKFNFDNVPQTPEQCRQQCQNIQGAVAFTSSGKGKKCTCLGKAKLTRHQEVGAFSGPTMCKAETSLVELEDTLANNTEEMTKVPMEEVEPCEKSPVVANFAEVEEKHPEWVQTCYQKATKVAVKEFNKFYQHFAKFVDSLSWKAGCGAQHEVEWSNPKGGGYEAVSKALDAGKFADCNWERELKNDENMWMFDEVQARGWTGTSRVNFEEQKKVTVDYPMPAWLHDLRAVQKCLKNTAAGQVENADDGQSTAVGTIMEPLVEV